MKKRKIHCQQEEEHEPPLVEEEFKGFTLSSFPTEIKYEILLKSPVETLSALRAVNKSWYDTIKHPDFIKTYNTNAILNTNSHFLISQDDGFQDSHDHQETSLTFYTQIPPISQIYAHGSCLLFVSKPKETYFICNPFTGQHILVPEAPVNPYRGGAINGFGWDHVSKAFKIVRITDDCTHKLYFGTNLQVYNSVTAEWRVINWRAGSREPRPFRARFIERFAHRPNTFLKGCLHWLAYPYRYLPVTIVSFKLDTEEFQQVPMPPGLDLDPVGSRPQFPFRGIGIPSDTRKFHHYLLVLRECLSLVHVVNDEHVEIWVMKCYGQESSWDKKYIIKNITVIDDANRIKGPYKPIKLTQNGEILLSCSDQNLGYYHPVTKYFRPVCASDAICHPLALRPSLHAGALVYITKKM